MFGNKHLALAAMLVTTLASLAPAPAQDIGGQLPLAVRAPRSQDPHGVYRLQPGEEIELGTRLEVNGIVAFAVSLDDGRRPQDLSGAIFLDMRDALGGQTVESRFCVPQSAEGARYLVRAVQADKFGRLWMSKAIRVQVGQYRKSGDGPQSTEPLGGPLTPLGR